MLIDLVRRTPVLGSVARATRRAWTEHQPLPSVHYLPATPTTGSAGESLLPFFPPPISTIASAALCHETTETVMALLKHLTHSSELEGQELFYRWGFAKYGRHWRYADIATLLTAASSLLQPRSYLEIGVRRGRTSAAVAYASPGCDIYGFDLWLPEYGGFPNPGPDFVRGELAAVGHQGELTLVSGDSAHTVPAFLREHPDLFFDLITVDGDHSLLGAARDMANVLPRLKVGGVIVFDDMIFAPQLQRVWQRYVKDDGRYRSWEWLEAGAGVAAAVRAGD